MRDGRSIDWIVMRNRIGSLGSRNNAAMARTVDELSRRIGFRVAPGLSERVIFRELFLRGLTLLDLRAPGAGERLNMSHVAARQEVRQLLHAIGLPTTPQTAQTVQMPQTAQTAQTTRWGGRGRDGRGGR